MPSFAAFSTGKDAKPGVIRDGADFTTDSGTGQTCTFTTPVITYNGFLGVPVRTGTGVWNVTLRDAGFYVIGRWVTPIIAVGGIVAATMQPETRDSQGRLILNWTFISTAGAATDIGTSKRFNVYFEYQESSVT